MYKKLILGISTTLIPTTSIITQNNSNIETSQSSNIILIMADDMGWGDVGFNGNKIIQTPFLDKLAGEGVIMNRFYSAGPLSSPTRASVLTGRNPFRTGVFSANEGILRQEEVTLPELLKDNGYTTGHFGKWHLGTLTHTEVDANRGRPENKHLFNPPSLHGYDEAFVTESKVPTYDPMKQPIKNNGRFWDYLSYSDSSRHHNTFYWDINGRKVTEGLQGDDSRIIMDRVIPFIDNAVNQDKPFFSVVWFHTPHLPCVAGAEHAALYSEYSSDERNYYGSITAMDEQVGRLVSFLKSKDVYNNTIILFCSDNGPELNTPGSAGYFRGKKRSLYEGGIRVPAFMVWKNEIEKGSVLEMPCSTSDYVPTLTHILNINNSNEIEIDGSSFWNAIKDKENTNDKEIVFCSDKQAAVISEPYKLYYSDGVYELYDINADPSETNNLIDVHLDITKKLKKSLHRSMNSFKDSFEGKEYGTKSYERVPQKWHDVMM